MYERDKGKKKGLYRIEIHTGQAAGYYQYRCSLGTEIIERVLRTCWDLSGNGLLGWST